MVKLTAVRQVMAWESIGLEELGAGKIDLVFLGPLSEFAAIERFPLRN